MSKYWEQNVNNFAYKIYDKLCGDSEPDDNIFFGPASIYTALLMVYQGCSGATADEVKQLLELPKQDSDEFHMEFAKSWQWLVDNNNGTGGTTLEVANRLWVKKNQPIEDSYQAKIGEYYKADVFNGVDFFGDVEGAREMINKWIEDKTKQKICNMIKEDTLSPMTKFMVTSAMYFFGEWKNEFEKKDTAKVPFYLPNGGEEEVDMMFQKSTLGYDDNKFYDCKVACIPYRQSKLRMTVIVPNKKDGLPELERRLHEDKWEGQYKIDWAEMDCNRTVSVYLPKFKVSQNMDLTDFLVELGVTKLFGSADLSPMTRTRDLAVDGVSHASYIDCNEKGTEVAVVTCSGYRASGINIPLEVRCDRPFLFIIGCKKTEMILFMGRITKPSYPNE